MELMNHIENYLEIESGSLFEQSSCCMFYDSALPANGTQAVVVAC